ncbi:hypothetical protein VNO78_02690 [Psophocarpus tetragonolobus]|uniref:Uncharacterized protein n=1 Tax=Psophocarpus tetragonolobus TaxID=3891 RepID=A0AAN9XVV4_PSOTE
MVKRMINVGKGLAAGQTSPKLMFCALQNDGKEIGNESQADQKGVVCRIARIRQQARPIVMVEFVTIDEKSGSRCVISIAMDIIGNAKLSVDNGFDEPREFD